jgi:hypothetical protein
MKSAAFGLLAAAALAAAPAFAIQESGASQELSKPFPRPEASTWI